jgi:hypothetical protein
LDGGEKKMMTSVPKWKVTLGYKGRDSFSFYISDNHIANVFTMLAKMDFPSVSGIMVEEATLASDINKVAQTISSKVDQYVGACQNIPNNPAKWVDTNKQEQAYKRQQAYEQEYYNRPGGQDAIVHENKLYYNREGEQK